MSAAGVITVAVDTTELQAMLASAVTQIERAVASAALAEATTPTGVALATTAMAAAGSARPLSRRSFLGLGWRAR